MLFDALNLIAAAAYAPKLLKKSRGGWPERFAKTPPLPAPAKPRLLIHAVSVGEVNTLRTLVPMLTDELDVVVSSTTDTGLERARMLFSGVCTVVRYPLDLSWVVRRFLNRVRPDAVALVELELWPNFIAACRSRSIPVCVINGRLSAKSFRGYKAARPLLGRMFRALEFAAVQDEAYAGRFKTMGVPEGRLLLTGSMKWDAASLAPPGSIDPAAETLARELGIDRSRPLVVAGSTAEGEEALIHRATPTGAQLLCAPRKLERAGEAASELPGCVRRSAKSAAPLGTSRFLLDTIGELRLAYMLADVVVMGRSFGPYFGSDPIEPVALGKPTITGPAVGNFESIVAALRDSGGLIVCPADQLAGELSRLLTDPSAREGTVRSGLECIANHRGASARHAELLVDLTRRAAKVKVQ